MQDRLGPSKILHCGKGPGFSGQNKKPGAKCAPGFNFQQPDITGEQADLLLVISQV
jgi:hypothetical protein